MSERMVYHVSCGCEVYRIMHSKPNLYRIQYCPKHLASEDMYKALKQIRYWLLQDGEIDRKDLWNEQFVKANDLTANALAKADGKQKEISDGTHKTGNSN